MKKVALITGGARGIGLEIARNLANEGINITIADIQAESVVKDVLSELRQTGVDVMYCCADVSSREDRQKMLDGIRQRFGSLNILVNNAGVAPAVRADILQATEESFERVMKINLQGPYFLTQAVANWMIDQYNKDSAFQGCIINISSTSAEVVSTSRGEYCISKAGVSMATRLWAARLGEYGIPVYEIRPGIIMTDMTKPVREKYDKLISEGLLIQKRWGLPEDVGTVAAMMVRGDIGYSTGQAINVDGGLTVQRL